MKKSKNKLFTLLIVAVVVGAAAFFGGMQFQKTQVVASAGFTAPNGSQRFMQGEKGGTAGNRMFASGQNAPVSGEIISADDASITVKMQDGSTKIVILSDKTTINKSSTAVKTDLKTGEKVTAFGTKNADGSITAQMVSLGNVMLRNAMPGSGTRPEQPNPSQTP